MPHKSGHDFPKRTDPRIDSIKKGQRIFDQNKKKQKSQQPTPTVLKANTRNSKVQKPCQKKAALASNANIHVEKWAEVWDLGEAMKIAKERREAEFMRRAEEVLADGQEEQSDMQVGTCGGEIRDEEERK